jgi:predicted metal-dependent phosphoesterase TrpH
MTRRYDLQVHTDASPCSSTRPSRVVAAATAAGLDGIVVTDHDTVANVAAVRDHAPSTLDVVSGVEVTTTQGHLLAIGVDDAPPQGDPLDVIDWVHDHGGVAVLSHPFDTLRQYYTTDLRAIARAVDAVEGVNSRCVLPQFNRRARSFAVANGLPTTGGSDAHFPREVGRAHTEVEGDDLLYAVRRGNVSPTGRGGYLSGHVATKVHQFRTRLP